MSSLFIQLTLAIAVSMLTIPMVRRVAPLLGLVDMPDPRKVHTVPIPRVGGWGITLGILLPVVLALKLDPLLQSFLLGCLILFVFGVWDDARSIGHWAKFAGQLLAVGIVVFYGGLWVSRVPFIDGSIPAVIGKPFTMFALIGVINAINHSDGLDGLAGGESILSLLALALLGHLSDNNPLILSIALTAIGGIVGFLRYNSHPAYVFMGDCGSQVLGFTLGFLVVYLTQVANTAVSAALPLLILGVPLADILSVLYQRIRGGMNWFMATRNHVHHRLLHVGFDHYETVVIIYSIQAAFVTSAVMARYESDVMVVLLYAFGIVALFFALALAERTGWRLRRPQGTESRLAIVIARFKASGAISRGPMLVIAAVTPLAMLLGALWVTQIPAEFSLAAAGVAAVLAIQLLWPRRSPMLLRVALYATAMFPAGLLITEPSVTPRIANTLVTAVIVLLALAIVAYMRLGGKRRFQTTPTDYLIVCGIAALIVFGGIDVSSRNVVEAVLFGTVLMYASEILVGSDPPARQRRWLEGASIAALLLISFRGLF
jgi:UDP-GlcNAc:undecaprenyl-phosphate/decaprenyl-phosphate GlcNAc-1-phosphate transferase